MLHFGFGHGPRVWKATVKIFKFTALNDKRAKGKLPADQVRKRSDEETSYRSQVN